MEAKRILVIGGTGYIGTAVVSALTEARHSVSLLVRRNVKRDDCHVVVGDLNDHKRLLAVVKDFDLVINVAAVVRTLWKKKYKDNPRGVANLLRAMEHNGVRRLIFFSTQDVYIEEVGAYGASKKRCEDLILRSRCDFVILRLNHVYGIDRHKKNNMAFLSKMIRTFRVCPVIGGGENKLQPVNKNDVAGYVRKLIGAFPTGSVIDVSGRITVTVNEIISFIESRLQVRSFRCYLPLKLIGLVSFMFPFDLMGFNSDRVAQSEDVYVPKTDFLVDLGKIVDS